MSGSRVIASDSHTFTALMVGYYATGKTALLSRFARNAFDEQYRMTLNSCQAVRLFSIEGYKSAKLKLVDSLGNGFGKQMVTNAVPECDAILLVYDITNEQSFYRLDRWLSENNRIIKKNVLMVLVGTHLDQPYKRKVTPEEAMQWKKKNKIDLLFEVSAKTNENLTELFQQINKHLLYSRQQLSDTALTHEINPEVSLILEDRDLHHQNSKITILQKKLEFKQVECDKLWLDYQEALRRISQLETNRNDRSEGSNLLSSIKDYETDIDQIDHKKKSMEDNIKVLEQFYNQRQEALEEATAKKMQNFQRCIEQLETQLTASNNQHAQQESALKALVESNEGLKIKLGGLQYDYQQKNSSLQKLMRQIDLLVHNINEKASLLDTEETISITDLSYAPLAYLEGKLNYLLCQIEELNNLVCTQSYQMKVVKEQHQQEIATIHQQINRFLVLNQDLGHQISGYEEQLKWYRIESILKEELQRDVQRLRKQIGEMEQEFDLKCEEDLQIIEQKEKAIRIIVEHSKELEDKLSLAIQQRDILSREFAEKSRLLEKKEGILTKVVGEKLNEINELRGFIEELGKSSTNIIKKYSPSLQKKDSKTKEIVLFFTHFFQKFQEKSDLMFCSFRTIESKIGSFGEAISELREQISIHQSEPDKQMKQMGYNSKLQHVLSGLQTLSDQLSEISEAFGVILAEINEDMQQIEVINQIGIQQYVSQYFN